MIAMLLLLITAIHAGEASGSLAISVETDIAAPQQCSIRTDDTLMFMPTEMRLELSSGPDYCDFVLSDRLRRVRRFQLTPEVPQYEVRIPRSQLPETAEFLNHTVEIHCEVVERRHWWARQEEGHVATRTIVFAAVTQAQPDLEVLITSDAIRWRAYDSFTPTWVEWTEATKLAPEEQQKEVQQSP